MAKHVAFKQDNIAQHYDELSAHYEQIYLRAGWHDPKMCADFAADALKNPDAEILDMGCGTGLVGHYLSEKGYRNIVGVDASRGMIDKAEEKGCYKEIKELFLGRPDHYPEDLKGRFDAVTASGILAEGHLDNRVFDEMLMSIRDNGFMIFATRTEYLSKYSYAEKIKELTQQGKWKLVTEHTFDRYDKLGEVVGRFSKTEAKVFVYQKL